MGFRDMSPEEKQTIIEHLEELRKSMIISAIAVIVAAVACFAYNEQILTFVISPLTMLDEQLIVTGVTEAFFVKLKLAFYSGFAIAFPIVIWSIWRFFKPALYPSERKYVYILLPTSVILFLVGIVFSYFGILPLILKFLIYIAGSLETMFKVDQYVSFILAFTIPFGIVFELPIFVFFLTKIGIVRPEMLSKNRKYAMLIIVILAAALTPGPDPISQMMMAVPVYLLYEVSIIVSKVARPGKERAAKKKQKDLLTRENDNDKDDKGNSDEEE